MFLLQPRGLWPEKCFWQCGQLNLYKLMAQAKKSVHCDSSLRVKPQVVQLKTWENVREHSCGVATSDETVSIQNSSKQGMILDGAGHLKSSAAIGS